MGESRIKYSPIPVKEILKRMKNISELMIDLSYCCLIFPDESIIREVYKLEEEVDQLEAQLIMHAALATRSKEDAENIVSVYNLAISTDYISDAAGDIARLAESGAVIKASKKFFASGATLVYVLSVDSKSPIVNKELRQIYQDINGIFDVIAVRTKGGYIFEPEPTYKIKLGDVIFIKGFTSVIEDLIRKSGKVEEGEITEFEEGLLDSLLQLKCVSELMVDLAYSAIFARSREIAEEIMEMEEYMDKLVEEFRERVLSNETLTVKEKVGMIGLADAYEEIADAAVNIVYGLVSGLKPHPVIDLVFDEALERITIIEVPEGMNGKTLKEIGLDRKGIDVLALRRGKEWFVTPPYSTLKLKRGDILVVRYYSEAEEYVSKLENIRAIEKVRRESV